LKFELIIPIPGGSNKMIDALHDDTVDVTHVATAFLIRAALAGSDAVAIAGEFNNPIYSLIAKPEIKDFADLKGKLLGFADEAGTITISTCKLLALHGLRDEDFHVKIIEGTPARFNCLTRGECVAVPLANRRIFSRSKTVTACSGCQLKPCPNCSIPSRRRAVPGPTRTRRRHALHPRSCLSFQVYPRPGEAQRGRQDDRRNHGFFHSDRPANARALFRT
jgi:NMT1/THI5 like